MRRKERAFLAMLMMGSAICFPGVAAAQGAVPEEEAEEEVVVTATRRAQSVQNVPYNISAYTGRALEQSGVADFGNLAQFVPGLAFVDTGPAVMGNNNNFILRGLNANQTVNGGGNPNAAVAPVSTYLGETPVFFPMRLTDLDRVEVLRGPQGTLYGSGSLGGTLRFIPKRPDYDSYYVRATGEVSATAHSDALSGGGELIVNLPIVDGKVAARFVAGVEHLGGFVDAPNFVELDSNGIPVPAIGGDLTSGFRLRPVQEDINDSTTTYFRAAVRADLGSGWEAQLNYMYQHDEVSNPQTVNGGFAGGLVDPSEVWYPGSLFPNAAGIPGGLWPDGGTVFRPVGDHETGAFLEQPYSRTVNVFGLDISGDLGFAKLSSTTSYFINKSEQVSDLSGSYLVGLGPGLPNFASYYGYYPRLTIADIGAYRNEGWSQELRLASSGEDNTIDYVVGVYYAHQKSDGSDALIIAGLDDYDQNILPFLGGPFGQNPHLPDVDYTRDRGYRFTDRAIFGELTWHVTPEWQITGGFRHFWQDFEVYYSQTQPFCGAACAEDGVDPLGATTIAGNTNKVRDTIFKLNTSYDVSKDLKVYATYAEGFRRGGANGVATGGIYASLPEFLTYAPDKSANYEIGLKGRIDGHVFTVAGFYIDWDGFQFDDFTPSQLGVVINGTAAHSKGIELELTGSLAEGLRYNIGYTYTDAQIDESFTVADLPPYALLTGDLPVVSIIGNKGDPLPGVPKHSLSLVLDYIMPIGTQGWELNFHLNGSYRSKAISAFNPITQGGKTFYEIDAFSVWDASVTLESNARWSATLFIDNIGDEAGSTGGIPGAVLGDLQKLSFVTRPRTFGLRLSYELN